MADSYKQVKVGKLKLKGSEDSSRKRKQKKKKRERDEDEPTDLDALRHGGWRKIDNFSELSGNVALQTFRKSYGATTEYRATFNHGATTEYRATFNHGPNEPARLARQWEESII